MPLQNRVLPNGDIVAGPDRGMLMGNRGGPLHDSTRTIGHRRWISNAWICCRLTFKNRRRDVMAPGRYTELFFLDEATALAAGHRPCFECRRADAQCFAHHWPQDKRTNERSRAAAIDRILHRERLDASGGKRVHPLPFDLLPAGAMYLDPLARAPRLVLPSCTMRWTPAGYTDPRPHLAATETVDVLTPPSTLAVLAAGYGPHLHATATLGP